MCQRIDWTLIPHIQRIDSRHVFCLEASSSTVCVSAIEVRTLLVIVEVKEGEQ